MISIDLTNYDLLYRELSAGTLFLLGLFLVVGFLRYIILACRARPGCWRDPALLSAAALASFVAGSSVRVAVNWGSIIWIRRGWPFEPWLGTVWYTGSLFLSLAGAAGCIWFFAADRWRIAVTICAVVVALTLPVAVAVWL